MNWVFFGGMVVLYTCFYLMGKADGERFMDLKLEREKYWIDRFFEHKRWLAEKGEQYGLRDPEESV